jgi:hypothetical protein
MPGVQERPQGPRLGSLRVPAWELLSREPLVQEIDDGLLYRLGDVGVEPEGDRDVGVPDLLLRDLGVSIFAQPPCCVGVAEVMLP